MSPQFYYLRQGGHVIVVVCLFVCLLATLRKTSDRICMKFSRKVGNGANEMKWSNFGSDLYHDIRKWIRIRIRVRHALAEVCTAPVLLVMAALCNREPLYFCPVVSIFFYLSFFLLFQRPQIGCLPYFYTWRGPSANLECRSEMCCTRLAANARPKKTRQKSPSGHHSTNFTGYIFATKACIDNRKKTC